MNGNQFVAGTVVGGLIVGGVFTLATREFRADSERIRQTAGTVEYTTGFDDGYADGYQAGLDVAGASATVSMNEAREAGEDYGYEAGQQAERDRITSILLSCAEDEVLTVELTCVPMDDADFTPTNGWVTK